MKTVNRETKARKMNARAMKKAKGGSQVGGLIFSSFRDNANPNGGVKCEHSGGYPEPRQGPMQNV